MRIKLLLTVVVISIIVVSCQKEASFDPNNPNGGGGSTSGQAIIGNWKFINSHVITKSIGVSGNIKSVTTSDYTTIDNGGVFTINATTITSKDFKYSVNTTAKAYFYESNILIDSFEVPMVAGIPPSTTSYSYRQIRPDSIFVDNGFSTNPNTGGTIQTQPTGIKIKFEGNRMIWTTNYNNTSTQNINGAQVIKTDQATSAVTFEKL